jgi:hypothetical protein
MSFDIDLSCLAMAYVTIRLARLPLEVPSNGTAHVRLSLRRGEWFNVPGKYAKVSAPRVNEITLAAEISSRAASW